MSDLRYYVTAVTKGKKPKVLFLTRDSFWSYDGRDAKLLDLHAAKKAAKHEPTHCVFVEATDGLQNSLSEFIEANDWIGCNQFTNLAKNLHCKTVSTRKEKKQPETQAKETSEPQENKRCYALYSKSADGSIKYFCDEKDAIVVALHKGQRVQIFTQSEAHELQYLPYTDEANADVWNVENIGLWNLGEPQETPEEKREYVLYRYLGDTGVKQFYYSYNEKDCYSKNLQSATLHTEDEAMLQVNKLAHAGSKGWFCVHCDAFNADGSFKEAEQETPTPAPEAKKRVGYVLYHSTERKEKLYAHYESNGVFVRVAGIVADAYRTPEDAQFAADVLNNNGDTNFNWQVEQVEF